jgi:sugar phosphate isomerase/epimerase
VKIAVSNLSFIGFDYVELKKLPRDVGLEIFYEFGNVYFWDEFMSRIWDQGRPGGLSIHGPCIGINLADHKHTHYQAYYRQLLQDAAKWQADYVVVHTNEDYEGSKGTSKSRIYDRLTVILEMARQYNVRVVLENVGLQAKNNLMFDWPEYQQLLRDFPQAGALLDVGHAHSNGWLLPEVVRTIGHRLTACHLHDNDGSADLHLPLGEGTVPWADLFDSIRQYAPQTTLVFEYANVSFETVMNSITQFRSGYFPGINEALCERSM